jgi:hypothetical protein
MTTLTDGIETVVPMMVLGWSGINANRTVIHPLIGSAEPDVTLRPSSTRTGTMAILCADEAEMIAVRDLHTEGAVLTLTEDVVVSLDMTYVVSGDVTWELDTTTRTRWTVTVPYTEITP